MVTLANWVNLPPLDFSSEVMETGDTTQFILKMNRYMSKLQTWATGIQANHIAMDDMRGQVQSQLTAINEGIVNMQGAVDAVVSGQTSTATAISNINTELSDITSAASSLDSRVETLENAIGLVNNAISTNTQEMVANRDAIALINTTLSGLSSSGYGFNIGPASGYPIASSPLTSPTGLINDYFITKDDVVIDGVAVPSNKVLRLNKNGGGNSADWDIDILSSARLQPPIALSVSVVMLATVPVNSAVDVEPLAADNISTITSYDIYRNSDNLHLRNTFTIHVDQSVPKITISESLVPFSDLRVEFKGI